MLQKIFLIEVQLIPTTRTPGVLQSMGLQGVRHDLATEQQWEYQKDVIIFHKTLSSGKSKTFRMQICPQK